MDGLGQIQIMIYNGNKGVCNCSDIGFTLRKRAASELKEIIVTIQTKIQVVDTSQFTDKYVYIYIDLLEGDMLMCVYFI